MRRIRDFTTVVATIVLIGMFIHLGMQKDIWFCDEVYSYISANAQSFNEPIFRNSNIWISGAEVTQYLAANDRTLNFGEISRYLFTDHVPLYFWILRIASVIAVGSCSKWVGLSVNLVFYILLFYFLKKLFGGDHKGKNIKENGLAVVLSMVCLLHPVVISEALTIRMYLMFTLAQVMILVIVKEDDLTIKSYVKLGAIALFGILTHFYFWIWMAFFSLFYLAYILLKKEDERRINRAVSYVITMLVALGIATMLFPNWVTNIFGNTNSKGYVSIQKIFISGDLGSDISQAAYVITGYLTTKRNIVVPIAVFLIVMIIYIIRKDNKPIVWLSISSSIVYSIFVIHTQPSVEGRYLWSAAILILIAFLIMLRDDLSFLIIKLNIINKSYIATGIMMILLIFDVLLIFSDDYKNIQYLKRRTTEEYQAIRKENRSPWIVFHDSPDWVFLCSMYDFTIPDQVKRVNTDEIGQYDEIIQNATEVIVYTIVDNKSIENCIKYIEESSDKKVNNCEKISDSYAMSVYKMGLEVQQ